MAASLQQRLALRVHQALERAWTAGLLGQLAELPRAESIVIQKAKVEHGDYATPVAMALAKPSRLAPFAIAEAIVAQLQSGDIHSEVAKPGYLNLRLGDGFLAAELETILTQKENYGRTQPEVPRRILLEYVSANPTGPLHVGHGRWAAIGSTMARLLDFAGHQVDSEFYINDAGNQMQLLGASLHARYLQALGAAVEMPEKAYQGSYIKEIALQLVAQYQDSKRDAPLDWFTSYAEARLLAQQQQTLSAFRTEFTQWFSERTLHESGAIEQTLSDFDERGFLYQAVKPREAGTRPDKPSQAEGEDTGGGEALFFKSADFGDDRDRVVRRAGGQLTYLAADIAYHRDKYARGYDHLIDIVGADHHGYVSRMKAAAQALGHPADSLELLVGQLVKLYRQNPETGDKEEVRMSKRTGELVTVDDLIEEVGVDATRWFLLSQSLNSAVNFDLDLAKEEGFSNPVFYVQYAHTRCCSILRTAEAEGITVPERIEFLDSTGQGLLVQPQERNLIQRLIAAPDEFRLSADDRTPQRLTQYVYDLAGDLSQFYEHCRILRADLSAELQLARLGLVMVTRQVLANTLTLLGIEPKEVM